MAGLQSFPGDVIVGDQSQDSFIIYSTTTHYGPMVFAPTATVTFNSAVTYAGGTTFSGTSTFNGIATFNGMIGGLIAGFNNLTMTVTAASATATITADEVMVEAGLGGAGYELTSFNQAINLGTTGAGGMDTGQAPVSGYVALYAIYNPTTKTASIIGQDTTAIVAPIVYGGANMPAGYTASCLLTVYPTNASRQFVVGNVINKEFYGLDVTSLNTSTPQASPTLLSIASSVPKNANRYRGYVNLSSTLASNIGLTTFVNSAGTIKGNAVFFTNTSASTFAFVASPITTGQTIWYTASSTAGTPTFQIIINGYTI